jgi:hypothetical protein
LESSSESAWSSSIEPHDCTAAPGLQYRVKLSGGEPARSGAAAPSPPAGIHPPREDGKLAFTVTAKRRQVSGGCVEAKDWRSRLAATIGEHVVAGP